MSVEVKAGAVKVFVLMRHEWRDMGEGFGDWTCNPVGVYANRTAAVAAACLTGFVEEENVEMYTVEFDIGCAVDVDAMEKRGCAV